MNRRIMLAAIGVFAASALTVPALAQESRPMGLSVRAGVFLPANEAAREENRTWLAFGGEWRLQDLNFGEPGYSSHLSISADWMGSGDFHHIPVLLNYVGRTTDFYYSAGVGIGFGDDGVDNKSRFAYQLTIGYDFQTGTTPFFAEAKYFGSAESKFNGFAIMVGVRL